MEHCKRHTEFDKWCSLCHAKNVVGGQRLHVPSAGSTGSTADSSSGVANNPLEKEEMLSDQVARLESRMQELSKIHPAKYKHPCREWDGLEIDEYDLEFEACRCFPIK
jgi:hypothetical protein